MGRFLSTLSQLNKEQTFYGDSVELCQQRAQDLETDLHRSKIEKDKEDIKSIVEILDGIRTTPFSNDQTDLVNISYSTVSPPDFCMDLLKAREKDKNAYGLQAMKLEEGVGFYESIPKLKL